MQENYILCVSNAYEKKYYFNPTYQRLPEMVKKELQAMCVLFTEDIGGILTLEFDEDGTLFFHTTSDEGDLLYDEIGSVLKVKQLQIEKKDFFSALERYYKAVIKKEKIDLEEGK